MDDWLDLIKQAIELGLTVEEVREWLHSQK